MTRRTRIATVLAVVLAAGWHGARSGAAAQPSEPALEAVSALRCWRRVDRGAVRIGEQFGMTVTCRVVESGSGRAVPDTVGLEPESIDLLPFEVLAGERTGVSAARAYTRYFRLRWPYFRLMTWLQSRVGRLPDPALFTYARLAHPWPIFPLLMGEYLRASRPASAL